MKPFIFGLGIATGIVVGPAVILYVKPVQKLFIKGTSKAFTGLMEKSPAYRKRVLETLPNIYEKMTWLEDHYRKMDNAEA